MCKTAHTDLCISRSETLRIADVSQYHERTEVVVYP